MHVGESSGASDPVSSTNVLRGSAVPLARVCADLRSKSLCGFSGGGSFLAVLLAHRRRRLPGCKTEWKAQVMMIDVQLYREVRFRGKGRGGAAPEICPHVIALSYLLKSYSNQLTTSNKVLQREESLPFTGKLQTRLLFFKTPLAKAGPPDSVLPP